MALLFGNILFLPNYLHLIAHSAGGVENLTTTTCFAGFFTFFFKPGSDDDGMQMLINKDHVKQRCNLAWGRDLFILVHDYMLVCIVKRI